MDILVLTMNIGGNAPGIVFERLIHGLSFHHKIDVITAYSNKKNDLSEINYLETIPYLEISGFRKSQLILLLGINPLDLFWAFKAKKKIKKKYDIVLSLISNEHYAGLIAGVIISKFLKTKHAVYSVDAIPAPLGWSVDNLYYRSCKKFIIRYLSKVDAFFAANKMMLNYQESLINQKSILFDVIYNPSSIKLSIFKESKKYIFLYTGEIYKVRHVKYLFNALQLILKEYPTVELHFVGPKISNSEFQLLSDKEREAIKIYPRTNDLDSFFERSFCLIDLDADIANDVFLSSKITNYIMINRPIICETGHNSPSRHLFREIPSILQCNHNAEEIYLSMKKIIENPITDFSDRVKVIEMFSLENIVSNLNKSLLKVKLQSKIQIND